MGSECGANIVRPWGCCGNISTVTVTMSSHKLPNTQICCESLNVDPMIGIWLAISSAAKLHPSAFICYIHMLYHEIRYIYILYIYIFKSHDKFVSFWICPCFSFFPLGWRTYSWLSRTWRNVTIHLCGRPGDFWAWTHSLGSKMINDQWDQWDQWSTEKKVSP